MTKSLWVKPADFLKTSFHFTIKNVSTHTTVTTAVGIELIEVNENGLTLKLPKSIGAMGHLLLIHIVRRREQGEKPSAMETPFDFTGKIVGMEPLEAGFNAANLQFYQFNEERWRAFLSQCAERQSSVNSLVKKVQE